MTRDELKTLLDALNGIALYVSDFAYDSNTHTRDKLVKASDNLFDVTHKLLEKMNENDTELPTQDN